MSYKQMRSQVTSKLIRPNSLEVNIMMMMLIPLTGCCLSGDSGCWQMNVVPQGDSWMQVPSAYVISTESLSYKIHCRACCLLTTASSEPIVSYIYTHTSENGSFVLLFSFSHSSLHYFAPEHQNISLYT